MARLNSSPGLMVFAASSVLFGSYGSISPTSVKFAVKTVLRGYFVNPGFRLKKIWNRSSWEGFLKS